MEIEDKYIGHVKREREIDSINLRSRQPQKANTVYHDTDMEIKIVCAFKNVILAAVILYLMYLKGLVLIKGTSDLIGAILSFCTAFCIGMQWLDNRVVKFLRWFRRNWNGTSGSIKHQNIL